MARKDWILLLLVVLFPLCCRGQDVVLQEAEGHCPESYFPFEGVCVSSFALQNRSVAEIVSEIQRIKGGSSATDNQKQANESGCRTKITDDDGDILKLRNGAIVEKTSYGYLGYIGYNKDAILLRKGTQYHLVIEGKDRVYRVDVLRPPNSCRSLSIYRIEADHNDELFIINGERFEAKLYCMGWYEGHRVAFLDGSAYGACVSASLLNINRLETCDVWCE